MSRRIKPEKREVIPDARFNNLHIQMMINRIKFVNKPTLVKIYSLIHNYKCLAVIYLVLTLKLSMLQVS